MPRRARASSQEGPRLPDNSFYSQKPSGRRPKKGRKARKSGSRSSARRARTKDLIGPRLPDRSYYSAAGKPSGRRPKKRKLAAWEKAYRINKRAGRIGKKTGARVTSKSGRTYKKTPNGNWSLVRKKSRKGGKRRSRR